MRPPSLPPSQRDNLWGDPTTFLWKGAAESDPGGIYGHVAACGALWLNCAHPKPRMTERGTRSNNFDTSLARLLTMRMLVC